MIQEFFSKVTELPALVMREIDTIVMAISGACKASLKMMGVNDFPYGTSILRSPMPTA
jgi:hypothetical protein